APLSGELIANPIVSERYKPGDTGADNAHLPIPGGGYETFKLVHADSRCRPPDVRCADYVLLTSAARVRARIYAPTIPSDDGTAEPSGIGRDRISAKSAPVCRGSTRASRCRHGPCPHPCEAEEGRAPPPASCWEESCCARCGGQDTDR